VPSLAHDIKWEIATSMGLFADERLVGFGQIVPKLNERLHLARLIIDPTMRGRGLGRELTSRLLQTASRNGARVISLNVVRDNTPAVTLYRALGFQERERPGDEMRSTSIYMERCPT
jgi:ribosomal protein S18 acetylase RimI-like enzyme